MSKPDIVSRAVWGARSPKYVSYLSTPTPYFFVHHTADSGPYGGAQASLATERAYMRAIQNFHMDGRGWSDIAYSYVIMPSGRIYEARGYGRTGGHTLNYNSRGHAGCYGGNTMTQTPTDAAIASYKALINWGNESGAHNPNVLIKGHRDVGATSCPGDKLYAELGEIRDWMDSEENDMKPDEREALFVLRNLFNGFTRTLEEDGTIDKGDYDAAGVELAEGVKKLLST